MAPWNESEVPQASDMVTLFTDTLGCLQTHLNGTNLWVWRKTMLVASSRCQNIDMYKSRVFNSFWNLENLYILTL